MKNQSMILENDSKFFIREFCLPNKFTLSFFHGSCKIRRNFIVLCYFPNMADEKSSKLSINKSMFHLNFVCAV